MYVLDEPSIGLHQRDNERLLDTLTRLRDLGNTVIVVEHDEEAIRAADHVVDIGPGAGVHGGRIVAQGTQADIKRAPESITGQFLSGSARIEVPERRLPPDPKAMLRLLGARGNNLNEVDLEIPAGRFVCVTGVSGSGKSTLINDTLYRLAAHELNGANEQPAPYRKRRGPRAVRQGGRHRPVADRAHAALQPGDLHRPVHADPRAVCAGARRRARAATARAASASTSRAAAARPARATA